MSAPFTLTLWPIYDSPTDFPAGTFVARRFELDNPTPDFVTGRTLAEVRAKIPPGLYNIGRYPQDDPKIVEVWI